MARIIATLSAQHTISTSNEVMEDEVDDVTGDSDIYKTALLLTEFGTISDSNAKKAYCQNNNLPLPAMVLMETTVVQIENVLRKFVQVAPNVMPAESLRTEWPKLSQLLSLGLGDKIVLHASVGRVHTQWGKKGKVSRDSLWLKRKCFFKRAIYRII